MNTKELEAAIRAELRAEARLTPAGAPTKAAVLQAIRELPAPEQNVRHLKRWTVPLLAAAAVVLVAVGLTVGAKALTSSRPNHPNHPINQQQFTPPPPNNVDCSAARGETLVNGLQTSYTTATGQRRYVFEYYCAGTDGHRTGSSVQVFGMVNGTLQFFAMPMRPELGNVVLSLSGGGQDGFQARDGNLISSSLPNYGAVLDDGYYIEGDDYYPVGDDVNPSHLFITGGGSPVAQACRTTDLSVRVASAQQPVPHLVLQLINRSKTVCALWGNPRYTPVNGAGVTGGQPVRYLLRGPAGGVSTAPSTPVLLLQPGATAGASIGTDPQAGSCTPSTAARVTLPDGVDLGLQNLALCNIVSYPLVDLAAGDDSANYPTTTQQPTEPKSCVDSGQLLLASHPASTQSGDGAGLVMTFKLLGGPPCTLSGYPTARAVDSSNTTLVTAAHTPNGTLGGLTSGTSTPPTVTLTAGQTASALAEWAAAAYTPTSTCERNVRISVTLGTTGTTGTIGATYEPSIGQLCDLVVHPFVAGDTGSQ